MGPTFQHAPLFESQIACFFLGSVQVHTLFKRPRADADNRKQFRTPALPNICFKSFQSVHVSFGWTVASPVTTLLTGIPVRHLFRLALDVQEIRRSTSEQSRVFFWAWGARRPLPPCRIGSAELSLLQFPRDCSPLSARDRPLAWTEDRYREQTQCRGLSDNGSVEIQRND